MKIELNHEKGNIEEIIDEGVYTDLPEELSEDEVKTHLKKFAVIFPTFDGGMLVTYLGIKDGKEIDKLSELIEIMIEDSGWDSFFKFFSQMDEVFENTIEEYKKSLEEKNAEFEKMPEENTETNSEE